MNVYFESFANVAESSISQFHRNPTKIVSVALCAIPIVEMSMRFVGNFYQVYYQNNKSDEHFYMAGNFLGTCFLSACLCELFPGGRIVGAMTYLGYSVISSDHNLAPTTSGAVSGTFSFVKRHLLVSIAAIASAYFVYSQMDLDTVLKTRAIFSRVWGSI